MPRVFLSYRRSDTGGEAGRLADSLKQKAGAGLTFRDVESISAGLEFDALLEKELAASKIVLVLIGPRWLPELRKRREQPGIDYLRVEVAAALAKGKRVIPLLLNGATLPGADTLPDDLAALAKHQAMSIRDESWAQDVDRLIAAIGQPYRWRVAAARAVAVLAAIVVGVRVLMPLLPDPIANDIVAVRVIVVSLWGIYALVEFAFAYRHAKRLERGYSSI